ncbi:hypothetical protein BV25DRAFT_1771130, partial [Artomyces pyxidatus]
CHQCGSLVDSDGVRGHVGMHILRALAGVVETGLRELVRLSQSCGFCGRSGLGCDTRLDKTAAKSYKIVSKCPRYHKFNYQSALKYSIRTLSTNVPVECVIC